MHPRISAPIYPLNAKTARQALQRADDQALCAAKKGDLVLVRIFNQIGDEYAHYLALMVENELNSIRQKHNPE